ncbi:hypothetical protein [Parageobacillus thermoglucosidasius]|nr:hypothetical protein [Parageobacillus thermoglucosidasius]
MLSTVFTCGKRRNKQSCRRGGSCIQSGSRMRRNWQIRIRHGKEANKAFKRSDSGPTIIDMDIHCCHYLFSLSLLSTSEIAAVPSPVSAAFLKRRIFINTCFHQQLLSNFWKFSAYRVFSRVIFSYRLVQLLLAAIFSYPQRLLCRLGIISLKKQPPKKGYLARKRRWHLRINRSFPI